jgi:putative ABC transport system permease protein
MGALQRKQVGDVQTFVNYIIGAVLFTLLFLTGNTMSQSVRDRIPELGVLKAVGFDL